MGDECGGQLPEDKNEYDIDYFISQGLEWIIPLMTFIVTTCTSIALGVVLFSK